MNLREFVGTYPLPVVLTLGAVAALGWTVLEATTPGSTATTLRAAALTTVLVIFAAGFWAEPAGEWYADRE